MTPVKKGISRKEAARMRRLREIRNRRREEVRSQKTKEQMAILLNTWSRQGIVRRTVDPL